MNEVRFTLGARPEADPICHCEERFLRRSNPQMWKGDCFASARNDICPGTEMLVNECEHLTSANLPGIIHTK